MSLNELRTNFKGLVGFHDTSSRDVDGELEDLFEHVREFTKTAADSMATDTTAATYFAEIPWNAEVVAVKYIPRGTATAHASNYGTIILNKHDGAGGSATVVASFATDTVTTDDLAAGVPKSLTLVAAETSLTAGQVLSFQITKASSGVALPAGVLQVLLRKR